VRIALYHPWIYLKGGVERTLIELSRRSEHDWTFYTSYYDPDASFPEIRECDVRRIGAVSVNRSYSSVLHAAGSIAKIKMDDAGHDALVISCDGLGSFINLRNRSKPLVGLCFTPLRAVYDNEYRKRHFAANPRRKHRAMLMGECYRIVDRLLWQRYDRVICISETVKARVVDNHLASADKIDVLYTGVDERRISVSDCTEPFFFLPGRIMWTKHIELGIKAFLQFRKQSQQPYRLVIAGTVDRKSQPYLVYLRHLARDCPDIEFALEPTDEQMQSYYRRCFATLFTAFNEDLGLTPMEAMVHGKPVIAVNKGGPTEVVKHLETGLLLPADENSFAAGMMALGADAARAKSYGAVGAQRVASFGWSSFVAGVDRTLAQVVEDAETTKQRTGIV
jgi:glycosyltransferase involved in cell wall biosynthesis